MRPYFVLLLAVSACQTVGRAQDSSKRLTIGTIAEDLSTSGGCALQLPSQFAKKAGQYIFASDLAKHAKINVDGVDSDLTLIKSQSPGPAQRPQAGEQSIYRYAGSGLEVEVDYTVTTGCPASRHAVCNVVYYDAMLTIKRAKAKKTVAARGVCELGRE